ncbi:hypothetical protein DFH27DRAFT_524146 [Peziza echinospora]|nr:hypothetical protein DFH27DRAFT_524146 [Peziza echinospora]
MATEIIQIIKQISRAPMRKSTQNCSLDTEIAYAKHVRLITDKKMKKKDGEAKGRSGDATIKGSEAQAKRENKRWCKWFTDKVEEAGNSESKAKLETYFAFGAEDLESALESVENLASVRNDLMASDTDSESDEVGEKDQSGGNAAAADAAGISGADDGPSEHEDEEEKSEEVAEDKAEDEADNNMANGGEKQEDHDDGFGEDEAASAQAQPPYASQPTIKAPIVVQSYQNDDFD